MKIMKSMGVLLVTFAVIPWGVGSAAMACSGSTGHMAGDMAGHGAGHAPEHQQHPDGDPGMDGNCHGFVLARQQAAAEIEAMDARLAELLESLEVSPRQERLDKAMAVIEELRRQRSTLRDQVLNVDPMMAAHLQQHMEGGATVVADCALYRKAVLSEGDRATETDSKAVEREEKSVVDEHAAHRH